MDSELYRALLSRGLEIVEERGVSLLVKSADGRESMISLFNLNRILKAATPEERSDIIRAFSARVAETLFPKETGPSLLFPRIVPHVQDKSLSAPWRSTLLTDLLDFIFVEDLGNVLRQVQPMRIVELARPISALKSEALENLKRKSEKVEPRIEADGTHVFETGDGHDAARALMLSLWFPSQSYFSIPSRDCLWVRTTPPSAGHLLAASSVFKSQSHPISPDWFLSRDGQFFSFYQ